MKYLVKFKRCGQISPEDFEVFTVEKLFNDNSTIAEIKEWAKLRTQINHKDSENFRLFEVILSEPERIEKINESTK